MEQAASSVPPSSPRLWVKPVLERIPLNEAANGLDFTDIADLVNNSNPS
jgi:hypothetical protein